MNLDNPVTENDLKLWFQEFSKLYLVGKNNSELIEFGKFLPFDNLDLVDFVMKRWVNIQIPFIADVRNRFETPFDPFSIAKAVGRRGFTYEEFRHVMDRSLDEVDYEKDSLFDYFHILEKYYHKRFINRYTDAEDGKDNPTISFKNCLEEVIKLEIPTLQSFFFSTQNLNFPISSLKKHALFLAKSGWGKSEVLKYIFYTLQKKSHEDNKYSLICLEPQNDFSTELLQYHLNAEKPERVVYLDPFLRQTAKMLCGEDVLKEDYHFIFNPFDIEQKDENTINSLRQQIEKAFFEILESEVTPHMKVVVSASIEALLLMENTSIADLVDMMDDNKNDALIKKAVQELRNNPINQDTMANFSDKDIDRSKSGIKFRLKSILSDIYLYRMMVGKSTINLEKLMNEGKVIIFNLSEQLGEQTAPIVGKLFVSNISGYIVKRKKIPKHLRKPTFFFIDEMQYYVTKSIAKILQSLRKDGLHLLLASQKVGQGMSGDMRDNILNNTMIKVVGQSEKKTREMMGEQMGYIKAKQFDVLPKHHFFAYNSENEKSKAVVMKVPPNLVAIKPPYYMTKEQLKKYFLWLANSSGYYVKTSETKKTRDKQAPPKDNPPNIYNPNFKD